MQDMRRAGLSGGGPREFLHSHCTSACPCQVPCRAGNDSEVSVKMKECVTHAVATGRYALALCF